MFEVGQMVVCVKNIEPSIYGEAVPSKNSVYTVRSIYRLAGEEGIRLREIVNQPRGYQEGTAECAFKIACFAPVRPQSIQIFTDIANGVKQPEKVS